MFPYASLSLSSLRPVSRLDSRQLTNTFVPLATIV